MRIIRTAFACLALLAAPKVVAQAQATVLIRVSSDDPTRQAIPFKAIGSGNIAPASAPKPQRDTLAGTTPLSIVADLSKGGVCLISGGATWLSVVVTTQTGEITASSQALHIGAQGKRIFTIGGQPAAPGSRRDDDEYGGGCIQTPKTPRT